MMENSLPTIAAEDLARHMTSRDNTLLLDVRTPAEFQEIHALPATSEPLHSLEIKRVMDSAGADREIFLICKSGARAKEACRKFREAGYTQVTCVEGGTEAWERAGLPIQRGRKVMSLERQVRIAAGSLVLVGVALGMLMHPGFLGLAGFVGAGLVFAGVTDTCGMALLLGRMPWNQVRPGTAGQTCPVS